MSTTLTSEYRFRDLGLVPRGRFSPVGVSRAGEVFGNFVPAGTGVGVVARWDEVSGIQQLTESLSLAESVSVDGRMVGSYGYGDGAFVFQDGMGMMRLASEADRSSAICSGPGGLVGGSVTQNGVESAVIFEGREAIVLPSPAAVVQAISVKGVVYGKTAAQDLFAWKRGDVDVQVFEIGSPFWIIGVLPGGELVLNVLGAGGPAAALWTDLGVLPLVGIGNEVRAVSVGESGHVLMVRTGTTGGLEYGIRNLEGIVSWVGQEDIGGLTLESLCVVGAEGTVTGLAAGPDGTHLIQGLPSVARTSAVVQMPSGS